MSQRTAPNFDLKSNSTQTNRIFTSSAEEFQKVVMENDRVIVDCFATWCGPCKAIGPILEKYDDLRSAV